MTPTAIAERELHEALVRYIARLRGSGANVDDMLNAWRHALKGEIDIVTLTQDGLARFRTPRNLAVALGLDPETLGNRAQVEVDRAAAMLELHDPILPHERG